ncbi:Phosphatidate cytidylyltransferase [Novipirellula aureliae]|uniref:Phosphatidate cytidylyltransferase n=1 Tax=Novipirellula aureliae TaxID=2527966 RepID=A0A5C6DYG7_9BACT|nr:phosphatidate cytidylyltransferase [Novipirellula aureliae]TWU41642.1 Phosphatidate cytidylyltransferase [Novipirellula aureliae]
MLADRLKTSIALIAVICLLLYLDVTRSRAGLEGLWLVPILLFFAIGTAWDLAGLVMASGRYLSRSTVLISTTIVTLSPIVPLMWPLFHSSYPANATFGMFGAMVVGAVVAVMLTVGREMFLYGKPGTRSEVTSSEAALKADVGVVTGRMASTVFIAIYVGLPMAMLFSLRSLGSGNWGVAALLTMVLVTKSADAGAYFVGRAIGKHKLISRLSPGKTVEGAIGGIVSSTIVAFVCLKWLFPIFLGVEMEAVSGSNVNLAAAGMPPVLGALILGPILAVSGMVGDLAESLVKRDNAAKDSGNLLPGLGGVWDVTDSLISAIMPAFLCFSAGVAGPIV